MFKKATLALFLAGSAVSASAAINSHMLDEEVLARQEEGLILNRPIAGVTNKLWFNYRNNIGESQKELSSDLHRATDTEDRRDAWEEYRHELSHERHHYVKEMAERGYRQGIVEIRD